MFARIENDQVTEYPVDLRRAYRHVSWPANLDAITSLPDGIVRVTPTEPPAAKFSTPVEKTPEKVGDEWVQQWELQPITLAEAKERLKAAATGRRWEAETGGITLPSGIAVNTATDDQQRIDTAISCMERYELESVDFKAATGWVTLTLQQLRDIGQAITLHVQACFAAERAHHEAIDALETIEDAEKYDVNSGWPGQGQE